jgi:hypothetical protein
MKPLFTIHGGEYLVGSYIEKVFRHVNVWVPSRDTGVDLLVTNSENRRAVSIQVKFSKDYRVTHMDPEFRKPLRACGWWTINRDKLRNSRADFWVFVLQGFASRTVDFVIVPPKELWKRLRLIHKMQRVLQSYIWITEQDRCWETRGLPREDQLRIMSGDYPKGPRDLTEYLNNWGPLEQLNKS